MVRKISTAQLRRLESKHRTTLNNFNNAIRKYNRQVNSLNNEIRRNRQKIKSELNKLNTNLRKSTTYTSSVKI